MYFRAELGHFDKLEAVLGTSLEYILKVLDCAISKHETVAVSCNDAIGYFSLFYQIDGGSFDVAEVLNETFELFPLAVAVGNAELVLKLKKNFSEGVVAFDVGKVDYFFGQQRPILRTIL